MDFFHLGRSTHQWWPCQVSKKEMELCKCIERLFLLIPLEKLTGNECLPIQVCGQWLYKVYIEEDSLLIYFCNLYDLYITIFSFETKYYINQYGIMTWIHLLNVLHERSMCPSLALWVFTKETRIISISL